WYKKNIEKTGTTWEFYIGHERHIVTNHINDIKNFSKPSKSRFRPTYIPTFERLGLNHGIIFTTDYNLWHQRRQLVIRALMSTKFLRGFVICVQDLFKESEDRWKINIKNGKEFDFCQWMKCFIMEVATLQTTKQRTYYVASLETNNKLVQSEDIKKSFKFAKATKEFFKSLGFFVFLPPFILDYIPGFRYFRECCERNINLINDIVINIINKRKKEIEEGAELDS
ncbi:25119_t:CDS:1, partial [Cetraspora pellucida]